MEVGWGGVGWGVLGGESEGGEDRGVGMGEDRGDGAIVMLPFYRTRGRVLWPCPLLLAQQSCCDLHRRARKRSIDQ